MKMPLADLTPEEKQVIGDCLQVVAGGKVIRHNWEFPTIMSLNPDKFCAIIQQWPEVDDTNELVGWAINGAMNNLLGYPHGFHDRWEQVMATPKSEVARVLAKWKGRMPGSYFDGLR